MSFEAAIQPLLDCMCTAIAEAGWEGECCLNPGKPAIDNCCEGGGTAWGRLVNAYPSVNFPREDVGAGAGDCMGQTSWALAVELGASMCVCDDICDCAQKAENATRVLKVAEAGLRGVLCCLTGGPCAGTEYKITAMTIGGPEANCVGFKIDLLLQYFLVCC